MFCFCLQSSLLKLQALEVDGKLWTVLTRTPQSTRHQHINTIHQGQQPLTPDAAPPLSPHHSPYSPQGSSPGGEGGGEGAGAGALLQLLTGGASPLPSPRCSSLSHSLRFNSDPETAPSPPCSQQYILTQESEEDEFPSSIPFLTRHIQTLKKKVRRFEDHFELEMNYKPSHNDKYSNPEMVRVMNDLAKARKQLKETRSEAARQRQGEAPKPPPLLPPSPRLLLFVLPSLCFFFSLLFLQGTKQEKNLVKPLYDRYQLIKRLLCASPTSITTIEEEEGSDEDSGTSATLDEHPVQGLPLRPAGGEDDSDRDSDPAFVSPMDEVKAVRHQPGVTTANLHEASRSQLLQTLRQTRAEKKMRRKIIREFEEQFYRQTGRICQKEDRTPLKEEYQEYKQLKAKLRLLEVLLSKQEVEKSM
uniref:Protein FAM13A-like n=1 Tax=Cynoglossus semilaevis TaxID=244447 RepID=A0A3P8USA7_CYNSE